jgi:protein involved in sex pheromone biosynthesis
MKKVLIVAATAGLMTLAAACTPAANNSAVETNIVDANAQVYDDVANVGVDSNVADGNVVEAPVENVVSNAH